MPTISANNTAGLWEAASGALLATLEGLTGTIARVAFSHDGECIAVASVDRTARLWQA
ncbi:MAG TPA: hypothetical protein VJX94_26100 [Stellaceae bacterium]|nr:hypothetical protein [Stellaceae bacterium]